MILVFLYPRSSLSIGTYELGWMYKRHFHLEPTNPTSIVLEMSPISLPVSVPVAAPWLAFSGLVLLSIHWLRRSAVLVKLPGPSDGNWLYGHFMKLMGAKGIEYQEELFSKYGTTTCLKGPLGSDMIFTIDPAIIHSVQIKDKDKFERAQGPTIMIRTVLGGGLAGLLPDEHRIQRKLLNPVFNMKFLREHANFYGDRQGGMEYRKRSIDFGLTCALHRCQATNAINKDLTASKGSKEVNIFPWATAAALDLIGEAGLGYSFNSFSGERNEYSAAIKGVTHAFSIIGPFASALPYVHQLGTPAFRQRVMDLIPSGTLQHLRSVINIQNRQAEEVLRAREAALSAGNDLSTEAGRGKDIMTLLMKANEKAGSESYIDRETMIGHMNVFIFAGHETTSTAVSRVLEVLAHRPDVQIRLREELREYFEANPNETHHDGLLELPYLDAIVKEVLRLYPPVPIISRVCTEDTVLPLDFPVDTPSGKVTSIPIKKGVHVTMSNVCFNRNKAIWGEQADEFLPERWIGRKIDEVTQPGSRLPGVYSPMMTFGSGSYACIGFKFAIMELKVMLAELIPNFKFEPSQLATTWVNQGNQFPYLTTELTNSDKFPKLVLKVTKL
ncbi:unnamed protein product [Rhizoctonia solani]|uniref:Cytochrome P450 family protein n=1 Tax=Rhizoctonia solani TaxID=456999 RepID=A0A8H3DIL1_9AGAM|nr:unnamed protein product [Rhizoctonia solani]